MNKLLAITLFGLLTSMLFGQWVHDWRGENRSGIYPESGLLTEWPENGPDLLWVNEELPEGYSCVTISQGRIFLTGRIDTMDVAVALNMKGEILWQKPYGRSWNKSYTLSRIAPTIEENRLYFSSGLGDLACLNASDGETIWKLAAHEKFQGLYGKWGISEHLLLFEDKLLFTPGGNKTTMVALDKHTGETIWKSESLNDNPSYVSPLLINRNGKNLIVNVSENFVFGIQPEDGKILWTFNYGEYKDKIVRANINTNTPVYHKGKLFITHGYNHKAVMLELSEDGKEVSLAYVDSTLDVHHGAVVLVDGYLYGSNWHHNQMGNWVCLEWETGKEMYNTKWENKGSIISAEGLLYCYEEKRGNLALVKADPTEFKLISSFKIPYGKGPHWSHPVIFEGILYIRHGNAIMAYNIKDTN